MLTFLQFFLTNPAHRSLGWVFLLLMVLPWLAHAQCPTGDITLANQAQVDAFPSGCINLPGGLRIEGADITSLRPLANLQIIGLNNVQPLVITGNTRLSSLSGLEKLTSERGGVIISNNSALTSLQGLNNLGSTGLLELSDNASLSSLSGLESLTLLAGTVTIQRNPALTSLEGLNNLGLAVDIAELNLINNMSLSSLSGLENIFSVKGIVAIRSNPALTSLQGLNNLGSTGGNLDILENMRLGSLSGLEKLLSVRGIVAIRSNPALTSLQGLDNLGSTGGNLDIGENTSLSSLSGLEKLTFVGGAVSVIFNPALTSLQGLNNLSLVGAGSGIGGLILNTNTRLSSLGGLEKLTSVRGGVVILRNPALTSLQGLNNLSSVQALLLNENTRLSNLSGLEKLTSVRGNGAVTINGNPALTSLEGLNSLRSAVRLDIRNNTQLSQCAITWICALLAKNTPATISGNAPGCNSAQEIQTNCSPQAITITTQPPASSAVCQGSTVTAAVATTGNDRAHQWYKDNQVVSGQTSATLTLTNVQPTDGGSYVVVVSSGASSVTSSAFSLTVTPQSPDYQPLTDLYTSTNGANWTNKTNWLTNCDVCSWYGVICTNGRVTGINLTNNLLSGTLPTSLSALSALQSLELGANALSGGIPSGIASLTALQTLNLSRTQLGGTIPERLGQLTQLQNLLLNESALTGPLPASLGGLGQLQNLQLYTNQLSGCFPASYMSLCGRSQISFANNPNLPGGGDFGAFCSNGTGSCESVNTAPVATANASQTATVGRAFSYTINAFTDAETPNSLTYSASLDPANSGLTFDPATRVISGTPTATGSTGVTITATDPGGLSATTSFSITVSPTPVVVTPLALTLTASPTTLLTTGTTTLSATVSGGTPGAPDRAYRYTFIGPGTITQTGNTASVSNLPAGVQTFTVVVTDTTQPTSQTITGTVSVTVSAIPVATQLTVLQRDPDNGQLNTNTLKPYLQLRNDGTTPIPYAEITVRYWLTLENPAPLMYQIGSQLGNGNVRVNYVSISPLLQGATGYLEFSFAPGAGSLGAMSNSGDLQVSATKQDYSAFNQGDDYSYVLNRDFSPNPRITAYVNGQIVWGQEPAVSTAMPALVARTQNNNGPASNAMSTYLQLDNTGNTAIPYGDIRVRYYFTADGSQPLTLTQTGYQPLGQGNLTTQLVTLSPPLTGADTYIEFRFNPGLGGLSAGGSTGSLQYQLTKSDYSYFDQSNDYSYRGTSPLVANDHVVVYVGGMRVYGTEPGAGARQATPEPEVPLSVRVLGNPVRGASIELEVRGAEGQPLRVQVSDLQGRTVSERSVERAGAVEHQTLSVGQQPAGLLLLRVSTPAHSQTIKVLKAQ